MREEEEMEQQPVTDNRPVNPLLWPWKDEEHTNLALKPWLISRGFTFSFLAVSWLSIAILGFGSSWNCSESWQNELICSAAIYANNIFTENNHRRIPAHFLKQRFVDGLAVRFV